MPLEELKTAVDTRPLLSQQVFDAICAHPQYADDPLIREKLSETFRVYQPDIVLEISDGVIISREEAQRLIADIRHHLSDPSSIYVLLPPGVRFTQVIQEP